MKHNRKKWRTRSFPVGLKIFCRYSIEKNPGWIRPPGARSHMLNPVNTDATELLGDWHPLVQQLSSSEGLIALSTASHSLRLKNVSSVKTLRGFLEAYQSQILIPLELPAIQRGFLHACRNETRELIAFDQQLHLERPLQAFASASRRVGQSQLRRLRPLRDHRLLQRYLQAVEHHQAHGWHTIVFGVTLSVYSLPVLQGIVSYERQTLLGFIHAVAYSLRLSEGDCRSLVEELNPALPRQMDAVLTSEEIRRPKLNF
jgi:urease accessory protein UreF